MKTLADLKRKLVVGARVKLVFHIGKYHRFANIERTVEVAQSNAVMFSGGSWLTFPKAKEVSFTRNTFSVLEGSDVVLTYEVL